jgi:hypothetical protein
MGVLDLERLKLLLDENHQWPGDYLFKFIVPATECEHFLALTPALQWIKKPSSEGKYISMTANHRCQDSDEVLNIYRQVNTVKGIITL